MNLSEDYRNAPVDSGSGGFHIPPEGDYVLKVLSVKEQVSNVKNEPGHPHHGATKTMLVLKLDIDHGEYKGSRAQFPLQHCLIFCFKTPPDNMDFETQKEENRKMAGRAKADLEKFMEWSGGLLTSAEISDPKFNEQKLVGLQIGAKLKHEEYTSTKTGKTQKSLKIHYLKKRKEIELVDEPPETDIPF